MTQKSTFLLNPTSSTPFVEFNYQSGQLDIIGKHAPHSRPDFYDQLAEMICEFLSENHPSLHVNISFEDAGLASNQDFFKMLKMLKRKAADLSNVTVKWYYDGYSQEERLILETLMSRLGIACHMYAYSA